MFLKKNQRIIRFRPYLILDPTYFPSLTQLTNHLAVEKIQRIYQTKRSSIFMASAYSCVQINKKILTDVSTTYYQ